MRETQARRDQREIVVPAKSRDPRQGSRRGPIGGPPAPEGWFANLCAMAVGTARLALRRPGAVFGSLLAMGAVIVVSMNALGYQMGRHPAPIFPKVAARPAAAPKAAPVKPVAEIVAKPEPARTDVKAEVAKPMRSDDPKAEPAPRATSRDTIGEIIKAGETTASVTPKTDKSVAQAQRALVKLGYGPLKADGVLGAGTRAAIEKFEHDRKLPVKGEPTGRTLRELASRAGFPPG
ncbi:peptidoglycan-binding protein [Methylobacterium sp. BTF04]|uniref:peptidoglycan-binding domain-containing protein n=1 Tax=Methylobacterium sp. BTF04 TaxID=2708300 RepID=UPI0013D27827|nr:peptidoglycan-binding domain-containing protein [Methylobacterium sp. BTF04]NEU11835.1 peptidoglycan-binding protein [Methylobacterium sp. BTF04]